MENTRRSFLKMAGIPMAAATLAGGATVFSTAAQAQDTPAILGELTAHELPPLPYDYNALEPYIDEQTMRLHHDKHHAAYVKGLNDAEAALAKARAAGDFATIEYWSKKCAFNGGGHFLHSLFWNIMAAAGNGGGGEPSGALADLIKRDFGGFDAFKTQFSAAAKSVEGAGWALLHFRPADGRLIVLQAENQHKLSPWGTIPVLGIDVWEHAYYLNYQNDRAKYVEAWWNVVNWAQVAKNVEVHSMAR